jgi:hypothetical protein
MCSAAPPSFVAPVFPSKRYWTTLEGGQTLDEFLDDFPTVTRSAAIAAPELAKSAEISRSSFCGRNPTASVTSCRVCQIVLRKWKR